MMIEKKKDKRYKLEPIRRILSFLGTGLHCCYQRLLRRTLVRSIRYWAKGLSLLLPLWWERERRRSCLLPIVYCLVIMISSCKVGKEYKRPDLELPQQF